ncbi:hypothetical protein MRB53_027333 [Persea americana]|uniref:Uncharacterized protein n=1 Tax=Persea americana TaxID=3435 RepID=A0ACC2LKQ2_PERAE|nr:hypothetical protein MRB53_027333 [Persea americana]
MARLLLRNASIKQSLYSAECFTQGILRTAFHSRNSSVKAAGAHMSYLWMARTQVKSSNSTPHYHHSIPLMPFSLPLPRPKPKWKNPLSLSLSLSYSKIPSKPTHLLPMLSPVPNPNLFSYNSIIQSSSGGPNPQNSISHYNQMRRNSIPPNNYTFPFALKACARLSLLDKGKELHSVSLQLGFEFDVFVQNSLIYMYAVCGNVETARGVFDYMPVPVRDVVSWNSMISGYLQQELCDEALQVFGLMKEEGLVRLNEVTAVSVLTACARVRDINLGRRLHASVVGNGFVLDTYLGASLIDMYVKCGQVEDARKVFNGMPDRNVVCWTSMIAGYGQSCLFKDVIELFREMQAMGVDADEMTIACVVSACGNAGALDLGRWVHAYCEKNGIEMNINVTNSLIDMYSKCGDIDRALHIFNGLVRRDVFSWTVMISGLAMNGKPKEAVDLFSQMLKLGDVQPNEISFLGVLSACSHGGLVKEGYYYFDCMAKIYKLSPQIEHYGCMVDLLGRANCLVEVEKFIRTMPIEPDAVIWRSLLFACKCNMNIELAEFAAKQILKLEPKKCGSHVLLSNVYAEASRWSDVRRVRKGMNVSGIKKQPACSFLEINGIVHEFLVADKLHPQTQTIYETIWGMNKLLKSEGYVPDISD